MYYVYRFLDKSKNIIYVGKSKQDLEKQFRAHLHLPDECYNRVHKIEYIECSTETDMNIKEIYYINKFKNENGYFNLLDVADLPISVEFNDKWKMYRGSLPKHFSKSINFKKGYSTIKEKRYNRDGSEDKRKANKIAGESSYVEALTKTEVDLIVNYLIEQVNVATDSDKMTLWFRNLVMFVFSVNLPLKPAEIIDIRYKDVFNDKDIPKSIEYKLNRTGKDEIINIPLRDTVTSIIVIYRQVFNFSYEKNANDYLFPSKKGKVITHMSWGRILKNSANAVGIKKNINTETTRKTYGLNIYKTSKNKLKAMLFLSEIWGGEQREANIIKYLNLTGLNVDFSYFFGEQFALAYVDFTKINFINRKTIVSRKPAYSYIKNNKSVKPQLESSENLSKRIVANQETTTSDSKKKTQTRIEAKTKLEIVNEFLSGNTTQKELSKKYNVTVTTIARWIHDYVCYGEKAFK